MILKLVPILLLLLTTTICLSNTEKQLQAIVADLDQVERSVSIKRLEIFMAKTKPNHKAQILLAQLYSLEKNWVKSLETYMMVDQEFRGLDYWVAILFLLNQGPSFLEKPEYQKLVEPLQRTLREKLPEYDRHTEELLTKVLAQLKDPVIKKEFCQDLWKKNSRKCRLK